MKKNLLDLKIRELTKDFVKWKVEWIESEFIDVLESLQSLPENERKVLKQRLQKYLDDPFPLLFQYQEEKIHFQRNNPRKLYITTYSGSSYAIDIIKSLQNDPLNITHPLIAYALEILVRAPEWQYLFFAGTSPVSGDAAPYCLDRIFHTIKSTLKRRSLELMKEYIVLQRGVHESFFKEFIKAIQSPEIAKISNITKRKRLIKEALRPLFERFHAVDIVLTIQFLTSLNYQYPEDWRALCNLYTEWLLKVTNRKSLKKETIKQYLSHFKRNRSTLEISRERVERDNKRRNDILRRPGTGRRIIHSDIEITESSLAWDRHTS